MAASRLTHNAPSRAAHEAAPRTNASFADLGVPSTLVAALSRQGISAPFPIQTATLRDAMAGRDVLGRGRTGSGKTLAFVLPMLARLAEAGRTERTREPRALILAPTRELARQILEVVEPLGQAMGLRSVAIFGGVAMGPQVNAFRRGVDVVVACPGRLEDHLRSRTTSLSRVEITVLDEADHMADLGFLPAVRRLLDLTPSSGQRMLFSATLDNAVDGLVRKYLHNPVVHSVDDDRSQVVEMTHHVLHVTAAERLGVVVDLTSAPGRTLVFTRTKHRARQLTKQLVAAGVPAVEMHGDLSQSVRTRNLDAFKAGRATTLVATDIAARGLHIDDVELVIHADPPVEHKAYLHRSGRTARAGASGTVVTIATEEQRSDVAKLGRSAGIRPVVTQHHRDHPILQQLAPGERTFVTPRPISNTPQRTSSPRPPHPNQTGARPSANRRRSSGRKPAGNAVRTNRRGADRVGR